MKEQKKKLSILSRFYSTQEQKKVNAAWPPTGPFRNLGPATGYEQQWEEEAREQTRQNEIARQQRKEEQPREVAETRETAGSDIYQNPLYTAYEKMLGSDILGPEEKQAVEEVYNEWKQRIIDIGRM